MATSPQKLAQLEQLIRSKAETAKFEELNQNTNVFDYTGGDVAEAYQIGVSDGQVHYARRLLKILEAK